MQISGFGRGVIQFVSFPLPLQLLAVAVYWVAAKKAKGILGDFLLLQYLWGDSVSSLSSLMGLQSFPPPFLCGVESPSQLVCTGSAGVVSAVQAELELALNFFFLGWRGRKILLSCPDGNITEPCTLNLAPKIPPALEEDWPVGGGLWLVFQPHPVPVNHMSNNYCVHVSQRVLELQLWWYCGGIALTFTGSLFLM